MAGETVEDEVLDEEDLDTSVEEEDKELDEEIPVRGAKNATFARQRIASKEAKKHFEKEEKADGEELTENAAKLIEKEVDKRVSERITQIELRAEITDYLAENPDDRKFEKRAKAYMEAHPTLTVDQAFVLASLKKAIDPEEKAKAEEKIAKGSVKGSTTRPKEEKIASTEADMKKVYELRRSGDPAKRAEAMKLLGLK